MIDPLLLITTVGHVVSSLIFTGVAAIVLLHDPQKTLNRTFAIAALSAAAFGLSFSLGINLPPGPLAYGVWMLNLIDILIVAAYLHMVFAVIHKEHEGRWLIRGVYAVGAIIVVASLIFPSAFLPEVIPKLFTKSYLTAGPLYIAMLLYFILVFFISFIALIYSYVRQRESRRQLEYFILATIIGYSIGPIDFFLVFDVPISPFYGMFFGLFMVPIAYGIIADNLMDIRIVIRRAVVYSLSIGLIAGALTLLIFLNDVLVRNVQWIQFWTIPIFTAIIAFIIARIFWLNLTENEKIKYEFITVATHKLRTPLTQIGWSVSALLESKPPPPTKELVERIQHANSRLIALTNMLFETTEEGIQNYTYTKTDIGLIDITKSALQKLQPIIEKKHLQINVHSDTEVHVIADLRRIGSVIEVLLENAMLYTPDGGLVQIITYVKGNRAVYSVHDSGIGVAPAESKLIFSRFYRTDAARRVDTEGVGLGLAMAKNIIEKYKGKIGVDSQGENKGSTFWFSMPVGKF